MMSEEFLVLFNMHTGKVHTNVSFCCYPPPLMESDNTDYSGDLIIFTFELLK